MKTALFLLSFLLVLVSSVYSQDFINGSFEAGDYTGWSLIRTETNPNSGAFGIADNKTIVVPGDSIFDYHDSTKVRISCGFSTQALILATDSLLLGICYQSGPGNHRMYQDISIDADADQLQFDLSYSSYSSFNSTSQFVAVHIRDIVTDNITETIFKTVASDPLRIPMNQFCMDISAYSGDTIRIDVEFQVQSNCMDLAFDNFRITKSGTLPDQPVLAASQTTSCTPGDDITLYVESGDLNASGVWIWYQDTCGLDSIGIGTIITVAPLENTSYFARAGGGCNSAYGACAEIIIYMDTIAPVPNRATLPDIHEFCKAYEIAPPSATDNCLGEIMATTTDTTSFGIPGNYSILWTFEDRNGNTAEQSQNVLIGFDTTITQVGNRLIANQAGVTYQWLDCNNGNAYIAGATEQSFRIEESGSYAVEILAGACIRTSECLSADITGIEDLEETLDIVLYPNPTNGMVKIIKNNMTIMMIYNYMGWSVFDKIDIVSKNDKFMELDCSALTPGTYIIILQDSQQISAHKLMISY
jgi:hypothetical protein